MKFKEKKNLIIIITCTITTIILFLALLSVQNKMLKPNGTSKVYIAKRNIEKGTVFVSENIDSLVLEKEIDKSLVVSEVVTSKEQFKNKIANNDIIKNEIISNKRLLDKDSILKKIKDPRELSIKFNDIGQVVGGTIREGDIVDLAIIDSVTNEIIKNFNNIYVDKVLSSDGAVISRNDNNSALGLNFIMSSSEVIKFNNNIGKGMVRVSKVR